MGYDCKDAGGRAMHGAKAENNALGQEARRYDSKEGIGRVESGTETENNAGAVTELFKQNASKHKDEQTT